MYILHFLFQFLKQKKGFRTILQYYRLRIKSSMSYDGDALPLTT